MRRWTLHHILPLAYDALMIPLAWVLAYCVRFNATHVPHAMWQPLWTHLWPLVLVQLLAYRFFGVHKTVWRYASVHDIAKICQAVLAGSALTAAVIFLSSRLQGVPRSIFPLYVVLLTGMWAGGRFGWRWWYQRREGAASVRSQRVIVVGAGEAGESLVRDMLRVKPSRYRPIGFVDDDDNKQHRTIHGVPVCGRCEDLERVARGRDAEIILIAMPSADAVTMRRVVGFCKKTGLPYRTLPSFNDLADGRVSTGALREVDLDDLLGRDPVKLDWAHIRDAVAGQCVMVTGAGGSIGSELCRQLARCEPGCLVAIEQSEYNLYQIDRQLGRDYAGLRVEPWLVDVTDSQALDHVMAQFKPQIVFHAAAYKHVPLLEQQVQAAVWNNVLGTHCVVEAAIANKVPRFVCISTDKAVRPTNVMGATKRVAELLCQEANARQDHTRFMTVRFGNVLGSAGSVVPLFKEQIAAGGPVTVTHPDIERFFMTIPEAAQLILQASVLGEGGEIFVLDMGKPVKIKEIAEHLVQLAGLVPGRDIEMAFTGLRAGEKLYEELFYQHEALQHTSHHKIFTAKYAEEPSQQVVKQMAKLRKQLQQLQHDTLRAWLKQWVPDFQSTD